MKPDIYSEIMRLGRGQDTGIVITVVQKLGSAPVTTGTKMLIYPDGNTLGTIGGGELERKAIEKSRQLFKFKENCLEEFVLEEGESKREKLNMLCGGRVTLFFEHFSPKNHIYIFGAGHIGKSLVNHLSRLDYFVTIIDDRKEELEKISLADKKILEPIESALSSEEVVPNSYFVVATYQHKYDSIILERIYTSNWNPKYVGVVSSHRKKKIMLEELKSKVKNVDIDTCYMPVGLNIGGTSPDEIAISIIAEIQAIRYEKDARHLRDISSE